MNKDIALKVAGVIFILVAILHLSRLFLRFDIVVADTFIPLWANMIGFIVALILSIWMFAASKK